MLRAAVVAVALLLAAPVFAAEWSIADMNKAIDQTNFELDGNCSATLIDLKEKLVLTAYHCVDQLVDSYQKEITDKNGFVKKVTVRRYKDAVLAQYTYDGFAKTGSMTFTADVVATNQQHDLAVIKIRGNIPHSYASPLLPDGEHVLRGERVYAVGNPAMNYGSLVEGVVSSVNRTFEFPWTDREKLPMIQFSGGIFGGNSGGALYNAKGQLIGVPAAGFNAANFIGLAIPIDTVKEFLKDNCLMQPVVEGHPCVKKGAEDDVKDGDK